MNKRIKTAVSALKERYGPFVLPIDLEKLAMAAGITIKYGDFEGEELSGFAYQKNNNKYIGVNIDHSPERKRFTIAHELGHLFLHKQDILNYDHPTVELVYFRDAHSSDGTDIKEIEANAFAAELLMPEDAVDNELRKMGSIDLEDENSLSYLADKFGVSKTAMTVRLTSLYLNQN